jgi:hypothetical protein
LREAEKGTVARSVQACEILHREGSWACTAGNAALLVVVPARQAAQVSTVASRCGLFTQGTACVFSA